MGRKKKQPEPEVPVGAPEWMVTFSDCMTLLLTFFVLLLSFSSFDKNIFRMLKVIYSESSDAISAVTDREKESFLETTKILHKQEMEKGSEKPTLDSGRDDHLLQEDNDENFHDRKVFFISSDKVFWGKGVTISSQGSKTLTDLTAFLKEVPNRIVISENGAASGGYNEDTGLNRSWSVLKYLTGKQGLDKNRLSISKASTIARDDKGASTARTLEVILLERSIYN
jgi:chemotaxis protein MotB